LPSVAKHIGHRRIKAILEVPGKVVSIDGTHDVSF
jgi:hypothetical protein